MLKKIVKENTMPKQKGFTLLEVLVTLLIMTLGLMGLAGIVINSLKYNQSAHSASIASFMANDIIDRMRANRGAVILPAGSSYNYTMNSGTPTGTSIARTDLAQWRAALATALPEGTGSVCSNYSTLSASTCTVCTVGCTGITTVIIQWNDSRAGGLTNRQYRVDTNL
jgi:type IV pilus assembly protein PilV